MAVSRCGAKGRLRLPLLGRMKRTVVSCLGCDHRGSALPGVFLGLGPPCKPVDSNSVCSTMGGTVHFTKVGPGYHGRNSRVFHRALTDLLLGRRSMLPVVSRMLKRASASSAGACVEVSVSTLEVYTLRIPMISSGFCVRGKKYFCRWLWFR